MPFNCFHLKLLYQNKISQLNQHQHPQM